MGSHRRLGLVTILFLVVVGGGLLCDAAAPPAHAGVPVPGTLYFWTTLNGANDVTDQYVEAVKGADGYVYVAAIKNFKFSVLPGQITVSKFDTLGNRVWEKAYTVPGSVNTEVVALTVDAAGDQIVTGSFSNGLRDSMITVKWSATPSSTPAWTAVTSSADPAKDAVATDVVADKAGNVYVCGNIDSGADAFVVKYAAAADPGKTGHELWRHFTGGGGTPASAVANAIAIDGSGNLYLTGDRRTKTGQSDCFVQSLKSNGASRWLRGWGGGAHLADSGAYIALGGGAVYVAGSTTVATNYANILLLRYTTHGRRSWVRTWDGAAHTQDQAMALRVDGRGRAYLAGFSWATAVKYQAVLLKYTATGKRTWMRSFYDTASGGWASFTSLAVSAGTTWVVGWVKTATATQWVAARYSPLGKRAWLTTWPGPGPGYLGGQLQTCCLCGTSSLFAAGWTTSSSGPPDAAAGWFTR